MPLKNNLTFIAFISGISGLLFGYDAGIISGAMLFIKQVFIISDYQVGLIVSAVPIGAVFSASCIGKMSDAVGRKKALLVTALFFMAGALLCGFTPNVNGLIFGRFVIGLAVGMSSSSAPVYIAEMAQARNRGILVTLFLISVNTGVFISYVINYLFAETAQWRVMLASGAIPAAFLFLCALRLPESPRWLVLKGKFQEAFTVLHRLHGLSVAKVELEQISQTIKQEGSTFRDIFQKCSRRVILLGIMISICTQAIGINAIIYYAPSIFQKTGFNRAAASIMATMGIGLTVALAAVFAAVFIDRVGRRKLLLSGLFGIIVSLMVIIYAFAFVKNQALLGWLIFWGSICFVACQGISVGPACFLLPAEIFPVKLRGICMGVSITFNWLTNAVVAFLFPIMLTRYGAAVSFALFLIIGIVSWILFYLYIPETKNVSLERIESNILSGVNLRHLGFVKE